MDERIRSPVDFFYMNLEWVSVVAVRSAPELAGGSPQFLFQLTTFADDDRVATRVPMGVGPEGQSISNGCMTSRGTAKAR